MHCSLILSLHSLPLLMLAIAAPAYAEPTPTLSGTTAAGSSPAVSPGGGHNPLPDLSELPQAQPQHPAVLLVDPQGESGPTTDQAADSAVVLTSRSTTQYASAWLGGHTDDFIWQIGVRGPVHEGSDRAVIADLDGLADSTSVSLALSYVYWNPAADLEAITAVCAEATIEDYVCDPAHDSTQAVKAELLAARKSVCDAHMRCDGNGDATSGTDGRCQAHVQCTRDALPDEDARASWDQTQAAICERDKTDIRQSPKQRAGFCTRKQLTRRAGALRDQGTAAAGERAARYLALVRRMDTAIKWDRAYVVGLRLRLARETLDYADATGFDARETTADMGAAQVYAGLVLTGFGTVIGAYELVQGYQEGPESIICRPLGDAGASQCNELALGEPVRERHHIVRAELRRFLSEHLAVAVRMSYDISDNVAGVEVPVYFLKDRRGGLAGGISVGYRTDRDEPGIGIFVSQRLTLLP